MVTKGFLQLNNVACASYFLYAYILLAISVKLFSEVHTMPQKSKSSKVSSKKGNYVKNPAPDDDPQKLANDSPINIAKSTNNFLI